MKNPENYNNNLILKCSDVQNFLFYNPENLHFLKNLVNININIKKYNIIIYFGN